MGSMNRTDLVNRKGRIDGNNALNSLINLKLVAESGSDIHITTEGYRTLLDFELAANKQAYQNAKNAAKNFAAI